METWRPVAGFEGRYEVSGTGRVRSCRRGKLLALVRNRRGYMQCNLYPGGGRVKNVLHHRLVARAFLGAVPPGWQVNHKNGVKNDNRVENVELVTRAQNLQHARDRGLFRPQKGEANIRAKLTDEQVREIRRLRAQRVTAREVAERFGVTERTVFAIQHRKSWTHLD
jgi:HNH endonuclease/NUMOD4 motif